MSIMKYLFDRVIIIIPDKEFVDFSLNQLYYKSLWPHSLEDINTTNRKENNYYILWSSILIHVAYVDVQTKYYEIYEKLS